MMRMRRDQFDRLIYTLLLALGGLQVILSCKTSDFAYDPYYYELAKSLLAGNGYGFNSRPEPMVPPGFPVLLAALILVFGHSYAVLIRWIPCFTTAGLIVSYKLLKSREGRAVASVACILLASSPRLFEFTTREVFSDMPYFMASMCFLWAVQRLDAEKREGAPLWGWWSLCAALIVGSTLLRSTGIALAAGVCAWLLISLARERRLAMRRIAIFVPLIALGVATDAAWILWSERHPVAQWPVHGFQESYVAQLKLKNGNSPETGFATWRDVLKRPIENEDDMATSMVGAFIHKQVSPAWYSPATVVPLALLLIGLASSIRRTGGWVTEWYFFAYQLLFLFWPWNYEWRFQAPVAPLAALYMWRGGDLLFQWSRTKPRLAGSLCLSAALLGLVSSAVWGFSVQRPSPLFCVAAWSLIGAASAAIAMGGLGVRQKLAFLTKPAYLAGEARLSRAHLVGVGLAACAVIAGVGMQIGAGLENWRRVPEMDPSVEAGEWIRTHSAVDAVVMARWEARVFHYSGRRVVWFPASTDPQLLMAGIRRFHIRLIVVAESGESSYWQPSDRRCFDALRRAYPDQFRQLQAGPDEEVWEWAPEADEKLPPLSRRIPS